MDILATARGVPGATEDECHMTLTKLTDTADELVALASTALTELAGSGSHDPWVLLAAGAGVIFTLTLITFRAR